MNLQLLQDRLEVVQNYLKDFKETLVTSENRYQASLSSLTDPALSSLLMEKHLILSNRQKDAIPRMELIQTHLQGQIKLLIEPNI